MESRHLLFMENSSSGSSMVMEEQSWSLWASAGIQHAQECMLHRDTVCSAVHAVGIRYAQQHCSMGIQYAQWCMQQRRTSYRMLHLHSCRAVLGNVKLELNSLCGHKSSVNWEDIPCLTLESLLFVQINWAIHFLPTLYSWCSSYFLLHSFVLL